MRAAELLELDNAQLFTAAAAGDADAFGVLYGRYFGKVAAKCAQWSGADAGPEDLAQEVFLQAWTWLLEGGHVRPGDEFGSWLVGGVTNYVITGRKRAWWSQHTAVVGAAELALRDHEHGTVAPIGIEPVVAELAEQLAALTPQQRLSVQLCVLEGRRPRVAAEMTGVTRRTMTNLKCAALAVLRARMGAAGPAVTA